MLLLLVSAPLLAALTAYYGQPQATVSALVFLTVVLLRLVGREPALYLLWLVWVVAPLLRRVLALEGGAPSYDPLSVLPFACTLVLALWDLPAVRLSRLGWAVPLAGIGLLFGIPTGLANPATLAFACLAYGSALSAVVLGAADSMGTRTLPRALLILGALSALYGIAQYFMPTLPWDENWLQSVQTTELRSVAAPEPGHIRVFGSLNSPGTFAVFLALAALPWFSQRRRLAAAIPALALIILALALTYVRSAWLALIVGAALMSVRTGRRSLLVLGAIIILGGAVLLGVADTSSTANAVLARVASLGETGTDISAQARNALLARLLPDAAASPFGQGLGQAGVATRLGGSAALAAADNGYLAILYQVGPVGFLLFLSGMLIITGGAIRSAFRVGGQTHVLVAAALTSLMVVEFFGDAMYGITGAMFWYFAGLYIGRTRLTPLPLLNNKLILQDGDDPSPHATRRRRAPLPH